MGASTIDAVLLEAGPRVRWVEVPKSADGGTLTGLQGLVGGLIECVRAGDGVDMWANEEGYIKAAEGDDRFGPNLNATFVAVEANNGWPLIVGPCVLTGIDDEGETVSLPREVGDRWTTSITTTEIGATMPTITA